MNNNHVGVIESAPKTVGLPGVDGQSELVHQHYEDSCAIRSQELILRDFGVPISEDTLRNEAIANGWYAPGGGTNADCVGNLLELHGVAVNRYENADIYTLTSELAKGHKVIIGVDSGELWNKGFLENLEDGLGLKKADHALIVSGIDTTDPDHVKVILTDPGTGDIAKEYPIEQFIDAWKDSNCFMVTTAEPVPLKYNPQMVNFDYAAGHISSIGEMPYSYFAQHVLPLSDQSRLDHYGNDFLNYDFAAIVSGHQPGFTHDFDSGLFQSHLPLSDSSPDDGYPL